MIPFLAVFLFFFCSLPSRRKAKSDSKSDWLISEGGIFYKEKKGANNSKKTQAAPPPTKGHLGAGWIFSFDGLSPSAAARHISFPIVSIPFNYLRGRAGRNKGERFHVSGYYCPFYLWPVKKTCLNIGQFRGGFTLGHYRRDDCWTKKIAKPAIQAWARLTPCLVEPAVLVALVGMAVAV